MSQAPYESLNLGLHVNDEPLHVKHNRDYLCEQLGVSNIVFMNQVHGAEVVVIEGNVPSPTCDAMITNQKGIALAVLVADCIPILLYDFVHEAIGVVHAGRSGSALHIGTRCLETMHQMYGSMTKDIRVWLGPCIRSCCYEVGKEVTTGLESCLHVKENRYFLDLPLLNKTEFLALGVDEKNIVDSAICTCCSSEYFSYRRDTITGRFAGVIWL